MSTGEYPQVPVHDGLTRILKMNKIRREGKLLRPTLDVRTEPGQGSPVDQENVGGLYLTADIGNNSTVNLDLADSTTIRKVVIEYHADRSALGEQGKVVLYLTGTGGVEIIRESSHISSAADCGLTMAGSLSGTLFRLAITSDNGGNATTFRANYTLVKG